MTREEELFLEAYRRALGGGAAGGGKKGDGEDVLACMPEAVLRKVLALADSHRVYPMVFESVYRAAGGAAGGRMERRLMKAERLTCGQARTTAEFLELYRFLGRRGLSPIVMKGIICRGLYPAPEQRSSSDEDLLAPGEEFMACHRALLDYGLRPAEPGADMEGAHEVSYCNSHVYIELHRSPFPPGSKAYGDLNRFFADAGERKAVEVVCGVPVSTMGPTDHLFYQLCHAYKHFLNCGIGIRLVSDIVLYSMAHADEIDWALVRDRCREIKADVFASALYRIGEEHLFPGRFPEALGAVWGTEDIDAGALLADILTGGVYGTSSDDRLHSANLTLGAAEKEKGGGRGPALLAALFPAFGSMEGRYPWLKRWPALLPAAWLHRAASYASDSVLHGRSGHRATEAVRIGNERVALMRRYRILEERGKGPGPLVRFYRWTHGSALAPVLGPVYVAVSMAEYHALNAAWLLGGSRPPTEEDRALVQGNVTFIMKSFERQRLAAGLCRNITRMYPGVRIIVADDSREPLRVGLPNVRVIRLPFNSGLGAGLAAALAEVRTPYVMRMDDDELLTARSMVHRELRYLMGHPELDLVGLGHTTAVRLHSPAFNFREYYRCGMEDAPRPLRIPHMTRIDGGHIVLGKVANIYLARTEKLREVGFDPEIRVIDHHEFFWRAAGVMTSAVALDTVVFHRHNPYERGYNAYRTDYAADLEYIRKKKKRMTKEAEKRDEEQQVRRQTCAGSGRPCAGGVDRDRRQGLRERQPVRAGGEQRGGDRRGGEQCGGEQCGGGDRHSGERHAGSRRDG